jgi:GNAT superfamily N-acetyltransferase
VRRATLDDVTEVKRLAGLYLAESPHQALLLGWTDERLEEFCLAVLHIGVVLVSEENSRLTGMLALAVVPHPMTGRNYCEDLVWFIETEKRGLGLARQFINEAVTVARERECSVLKMTAPAGTAVGALLKRAGMREVETSWVLDVPP